MISKTWLFALLPLPLLNAAAARADDAPRPVTVTVDAAASRHPISPLIYGVAFANAREAAALNASSNRQGGNNFTRYNWRANTVNIDSDWYFESIPGFFLNQPTSLVPGQRADSFIAASKAAGAQPIITIPMIGWVAKVVSPDKTLSSFSVAKYGPQQKTAPGNSDAGNGFKPDGTPIAGNDPNDASVPSSPSFQRDWVKHIVQKWGTAAHGGVRYYIMDNEPGLWHLTHRDVHPKGFTSDEYLKDFLNYTSMVKSVDPGAVVIGPEEWGWPSYFYSGADSQYRAAHHYQGAPDRAAHGGMPFLPWLLDSIRRHDAKTGRRLLDVFSVHIYPQGGDNNNNASPRIALLRNRDTRCLWDPNYQDESWINDRQMLIPRLKQWVRQYYPGTKVGITEYGWGAEDSINGATAQADILGIFGREGLDMANHWQMHDAASPAGKAFRMYRNYDGRKSTFGDVSVSDAVPDPDTLSSFAALRSSDHALTVMVINKSLDTPAAVTLALSHFAPGKRAQAWQLTSANAITRLPDVPVRGKTLTTTVPAQSITLYVIPRL